VFQGGVNVPESALHNAKKCCGADAGEKSKTAKRSPYPTENNEEHLGLTRLGALWASRAPLKPQRVALRFPIQLLADPNL
jgi:hypothetical protein